MRPYKMSKSRSLNTDERERFESYMATQGVHRSVEDKDMPDHHVDQPCDKKNDESSTPYPTSASQTQKYTQPLDDENVQPISPPHISHDSNRNASRRSSSGSDSQAQRSSQWQSPFRERMKDIDEHEIDTGGKGQAHDPLLDYLFLNIGNGPDCSPAHLEAGGIHVVCESPGAVDINVYETAYREQVKHILQTQGRQATLFLTRRVEENKGIREIDGVVGWEDGSVKGYVAGEEEGQEDGSGGEHSRKGDVKSAKTKLQGAIGKIAS